MCLPYPFHLKRRHARSWPAVLPEQCCGQRGILAVLTDHLRCGIEREPLFPYPGQRAGLSVRGLGGRRFLGPLVKPLNVFAQKAGCKLPIVRMDSGEDPVVLGPAAWI